MPSQPQHKRISASSTFTYKSSIVFSAILAFLISFMFMGTAFARFFSGLFIILASFTLAAHAITRPTNWFEFDDENKMIIKAFRNRTPYNKIQAIVISETFKRITINVKTNWMPPYPIASGLSRVDAASAEKEFMQRFPADIIRKESYSNKRRAVLVTIVSLVVIIVFANYLYHLYRMAPPEVVTAEKKEWLDIKQPREGQNYQINGIDFLLPDRFAQVKQEEGWHYFEDRTSKAKIKVGPGVFHNTDFKQRFVFGLLIGLRDDYDLFRLAYTARYGLIPTLNNSHAFRDLFDIKLYEVNRGELRGIVLQGMRGSKSVAEIIVTGKEQGIHVFMSQPGEIGKIKEDLLQSIVASIQSGV